MKEGMTAQSSLQSGKQVRALPAQRRQIAPDVAEGDGPRFALLHFDHPFHPLSGQQFEILNYLHNGGEYRIMFYQTPDHVRSLLASWTSIVAPDLSVVLAAGRAVFRVADLLQLSHLIGRIKERHREKHFIY